MNHKEIETTARNPSVGADEGQASKMYTPISADPGGEITLRTVVETLPRDDARRLRRLRRCFWGRQFYRRTVAEGKKTVADGLLEHGKNQG